MKKFLLSVLLFVSSSANALLMSDVGSVDTFISSTTLSSSGDAVEEAWVESVLGFNVVFESKTNTGSNDWQSIDDESDGDGIEDIFARQLSVDTDYFLLKLGTGGTSLESHYLFQNIGKLDWAVVDFSTAGVDLSIKKINIGRLSHQADFAYPETTTEYNVPEPSIIALLGLGLLGLGLARRKA